MLPLAPARRATLLLALTLGCAAPRESSPPPPQPAAASEATVFRGMLVWSDDVGELKPCDGGAPLRVAAGDGIDLGEIHRSLSPGGDLAAEVYVDVAGSTGPSTPPGSGSTPLLTVDSVRFAHPAGEGPGCADAPQDWLWRAAGNEPFWSVTVGPDRVAFSTPEAMPGWEFGDVSVEGAPSAVTVHAASAGSALELTLTAAPCRDSMSGAWYGFSAHVVVGERRLDGCGRPGTATR